LTLDQRTRPGQSASGRSRRWRRWRFLAAQRSCSVCTALSALRVRPCAGAGDSGHEPADDVTDGRADRPSQRRGDRADSVRRALGDQGFGAARLDRLRADLASAFDSRAAQNTLVGPALFMLDADHAWSITDAHTIYRTSDGGASWAPRLCPTTCGIQFGMSFVDAQVGM